MSSQILLFYPLHFFFCVYPTPVSVLFFPFLPCVSCYLIPIEQSYPKSSFFIFLDSVLSSGYVITFEDLQIGASDKREFVTFINVMILFFFAAEWYYIA